MSHGFSFDINSNLFLTAAVLKLKLKPASDETVRFFVAVLLKVLRKVHLGSEP